MARRPTYRDVWCPLCHHERSTGAPPRTKLKCPSCGGYYRAPDLPASELEEIPTADVTASTPAPAGDELEAAGAPARSTRSHGTQRVDQAGSYGGRRSGNRFRRGARADA